ncbi:hypothetical protein [Fusibacter sp. JL216-2]|uniref:hypothetical protein n=1 Tax=Fusibacter sp. JL216-2 TaxID=3071453 RepID=UPI003D331E5E
MITKSKDILTSLIMSVPANIAQISFESVPDTGLGPGMMLELDSTSITPQSKFWAEAVVGWRLSYFPEVGGHGHDAYEAFEKIIERVFDQPLEENTEGAVYRFKDPKTIRTNDGVFLKITTITNIQRNTEVYDQVKDVQLSTGG